MDGNCCLLNGEIFTTFNAMFICFLKFRSIVKKMFAWYDTALFSPGTGVKMRNKTKQHGEAALCALG